ncbi:MAG: hypothetical protein L6Q99_11325 [Planctomycetes bacterium]|nr:hypothetical protein [Planctomycetota bacterium]
MEAKARLPLVFVAGALLGAGGAFAVFTLRTPEVVARESATDAPPRDVRRVEDGLVAPGPSAPTERATDTDRVAVDARATAPTAPQVGAAAANGELLLELLERGRREGWFADAQFAELLFWQLVSRGLLEDAWNVARTYAPSSQHLFLNLASTAHQRHEFALRDAALQHALSLGWVDPSFLAQIDPELGLARYAEMLAVAAPDERSAVELGYAQFLYGLGRNDEALAIARSRLASHPNDEQALDLLCALDLEAGEAHLRRLIDARDPQNDWTRKLIALLNQNGRTAEAAQRLADLAASGKPVYAGDWGEIADAALASQDSVGAVDAWLRALELESGDPDAWTNPLLVQAPDKLLAALEARVATGEHDEFWGALGDVRWKLGLHTAGVDAWQQAATLDPTDMEWSAKLAAAAAGTNPLGD